MSVVKEKIVLLTPAAKTRYSHLNAPDTKFDRDGIYKTTLVLDQNHEDTKTFVRQIEEAARTHFWADAAKVNLPLSTDEGTGELLFKAKTKFAPKFVDSEGVLLNAKTAPNVYSGSTVRMYVKLEPTEAKGQYYLSSFIQIVQILHVVEDSVGSQDFVFPTVEDGFKARPDLGGASDLQPGDPGAADTFRSYLD